MSYTPPLPAPTEAGTDHSTIRPAVVADIPELVEIENRSFDSDRLTRRSFTWLITRGNASLLVAERGRRINGYVLVLFHSGTSLARLYSLAVPPELRGRGLARRLMEAAEEQARDRSCAYMRLEVRPDNAAAIRLYESLGYRRFAVISDYYEDHAAALRLEKRILFGPGPGVTLEVPYYSQLLEFTCGPAALLMAMSALDPSVPLGRAEELQLWREATTIFMTSGHGGCAPQGLALAAHRRGFDVELFISEQGPLFLDGVRSEEKKTVLRVVHESFSNQLAESGIRLHERPFSARELADRLDRHAVPVVLISSYRICRQKSPHWIVLTAVDERFIYAHDPFVDEEEHKTAVDCMHIPIKKSDFERMARYGKSQLKAALVLSLPDRAARRGPAKTGNRKRTRIATPHA